MKTAVKKKKEAPKCNGLMIMGDLVTWSHRGTKDNGGGHEWVGAEVGRLCHLQCVPFQVCSSPQNLYTHQKASSKTNIFLCCVLEDKFNYSSVLH